MIWSLMTKEGPVPKLDVREPSLYQDLPSRTCALGLGKESCTFLPAGTRPVNALWLFIDIGDTVVLAQVASGGPGILGEDANPLLDTDLLIEVMVEHLRPYPE